MSVYLDASVLVTLLRSESGSDAVANFIGNFEGDLVASDFGRGEVGAVVSRFVRTGEIAADIGMRLLAEFDEWMSAAVDLVATLDSDVRHAAQLVRRFELKLRMPDAIHLATCQAMRWQLATFDRGMLNAARELNIELIDLSQT